MPVFAAVGDAAYNVTLLLHFAAVICAFAPAFVHPTVTRALQGRSDTGARAALEAMARSGYRIYAPALVLAGLLGVGLVLQSGDAYSLADAWISAAFLVWFVMIGILVGLLVPAEKRLATGDPGAARLVGAFGGALHLLLVVMLVLMVWKPGA